ncbi:hypothetical protein DPMN_152819, partial [Dreissena polymorpha]
MNNRAILEGATSLTPPSIAFSIGSAYLRRAYYLPHPREKGLYNVCNRKNVN